MKAKYWNLDLGSFIVPIFLLLHVLSILHIAVCLPTRWLAGNTRDLAEHDFGYFDMGTMLDLLDGAFGEILEDGSLLLDEDFMMDILTNLRMSE